MSITFRGLEDLNNILAETFPKKPPKIDKDEFDSMTGLVEMRLPTITEPTKLWGSKSLQYRSVVVIPGTPRFIFVLLTRHETRGDSIIGKGSQCTVKPVIDLLTGKVYAVVVQRFNDRAKYDRHLEQSSLGLEALKACQGDHIMPYYGHYEEITKGGGTSLGKRMIFTEFYPEGDLLSALQRAAFPLSEKISISRQLTAAVSWVHRVGWVHADIKPDNILLSLHEEKGRGAVLADFGLAAQKHIRSCGSLAYVAPEIAATASQEDRMLPSPQTDLWSLGATLFGIQTGRHILEMIFEATRPIDPRRNGDLFQAFRKIWENPRECQKAIDHIMNYIQQQDQQFLKERLENAPEEKVQEEMKILERHFSLLRSLLQVNPSLRKIPEEFFNI